MTDRFEKRSGPFGNSAFTLPMQAEQTAKDGPFNSQASCAVEGATAYSRGAPAAVTRRQSAGKFIHKRWAP